MQPDRKHVLTTFLFIARMGTSFCIIDVTSISLQVPEARRESLEWGRSQKDKMIFIARMRLLADHTWDILELAQPEESIPV